MKGISRFYSKKYFTCYWCDFLIMEITKAYYFLFIWITLPAALWFSIFKTKEEKTKKKKTSGILTYHNIALADPGGRRRRAPPKGPFSFVLTQIFLKRSRLGSWRPPPYGKSWIRHCIVHIRYQEQIILMEEWTISTFWRPSSIFIIIGDLSHIICLKSHWIFGSKTSYWRKNEQLVHFGAKSNFYFYPDRRTLKFLKMQCNPTN